jgi:hypothetical protein
MKQCSEGFSYSACMISAKIFVVLRDIIHCTERHISPNTLVKNTVRRGVVLNYLFSPKRELLFGKCFKHQYCKFTESVKQNFLVILLCVFDSKPHRNSEVDFLIFCYSHCNCIINKYIDSHKVFCEWSKYRSFHDLFQCSVC